VNSLANLVRLRADMVIPLAIESQLLSFPGFLSSSGLDRAIPVLGFARDREHVQFSPDPSPMPPDLFSLL